MNRTDLQLLAEEQLADAELLLANSRFGAASYLAGYAVECALKACIAKLTKAEDFPNRNSTNRAYVHDLKKLAGESGAEVAIAQIAKNDPAFERSAFGRLLRLPLVLRGSGLLAEAPGLWVCDPPAAPRRGAT